MRIANVYLNGSIALMKEEKAKGSASGFRSSRRSLNRMEANSVERAPRMWKPRS